MPFFRSKSLFNLVPSYAVVFKRKDVVKYNAKYPNTIICFWV